MDETHIKDFKIQSQKQLHELEPENITLFQDEEVAENYTIVARPSQELVEKIQEFISELKELDDNQFYYKPENLHLTIWGGVEVPIDEQEFVEKSSFILKKYFIQFNMIGIGSNALCSSINAYPKDFSIHQLREELRSSFQSHGTTYTIHLSSYEYMGWMNYLRYLHIPSETYLNYLKKNVERHFGEFIPSKLELYKARGKILNYGKDRLIHTFA